MKRELKTWLNEIDGGIYEAMDVNEICERNAIEYFISVME